MAIIKTLLQAGAVLGAVGMVTNMQKKKHEDQGQYQNQNQYRENNSNNNNGYYGQGQQSGSNQGYYDQGQGQQNGYARQSSQPPIYREAEKQKA
jgi:hypothetical protein